MNRPRLLLVTSRFPFPVIGGDKLRVFNLLQQLQRAFDVSLVALGQPPAEDVEALRQSTGVQAVVTVPHPRWRSLLGAVSALLTGRPLQVGYYRSPALDAAVAERLGAADVVVCHLIRTSATLGSGTAPMAVLEMCDAISANFEQTANEGRWWSPWRWISRIEAPRTLRFERHEAARFDLVSLHTRKDALRIGIPSHKLLISTQGAQIQRLPFIDPLQRNGNKIALIGKMDFFPNWHGAAWFARHVLPLLPEPMRLKVVGDCPPNIRARLEALPRVEVTGRVDSLADACADCVAAIAPMKVATGIQNKVLEYFAMGLPSVVSESVAAGLLPAADGACHVATTPTQWADALRRVAADPSAASAMARSARAYVQSCHSWDHIGSEYIERLQQLLHATPRPSAVPELT